MYAREAKILSPSGYWVGKEAMKVETLIKLPYTVKGNDVAYSGLLTAAAMSLRRQGNLADLCFSLQETAFSMLSEAVDRSLVQTRRIEVLLAGGAAASPRLSEIIGSVSAYHNTPCYTSHYV